MTNDLNMAMIGATYKLEQVQNNGIKTVGTGWLVNLSSLGHDKIAVITAKHVFDRMENDDAQIHWRYQNEDGNWMREAQSLPIRQNGNPIWYQHTEHDIAAVIVNPPNNGPKQSAIPFDQLADEQALKTYEIGPGDELMALGYPRGLSANHKGFPILRSGRVASYPLWPIKEFPTFLMDFAVFAGNSGGPVYISDRIRRRVGATDIHEAHLVTGMLAQQVILTDERLEIGIVLHSGFVRECLMGLLAREYAVG